MRVRIERYYENSQSGSFRQPGLLRDEKEEDGITVV
jgi:hypothetical protein